MIAKFEDRLVRDPLPLPPRIDPLVIKDFDYRRVYATGRFRHDQEMLIGPRIHAGNNGYLVITPLERDTVGSTVLVNRGWIPKDLKRQADRTDGLPKDQVIVEGLLRAPWKKNMFTPENKPELKEFYFPDVEQMARLAGSQPVWIEETMSMSYSSNNDICILETDHVEVPDLLTAYDREARGIPIGRAPEINLRNNHAQYIFTWSVLLSDRRGMRDRLLSLQAAHSAYSYLIKLRHICVQVCIVRGHDCHVMDGYQEAAIRDHTQSQAEQAMVVHA